MVRACFGARSSYKAVTNAATQGLPKIQNVVQPGKSALSRIPTNKLIRSLLLTSMMSKDWILTPSLKVLSLITKANGALFNPDRNPMLNRLFRMTLYSHFCAGNTSSEVSRSIKELKGLGYQGIILGHARELLLDPTTKNVHSAEHEYSPACYRMVEEWKQLNLDTLRMLQPGDFLALKLTGAGLICTDALQAREPMPGAIRHAVDEICIETKRRGARLWVDAEQQIFQVGLDEWVIDMMRKYNRDRTPLVFNTIQAYLKGARHNAARHVTLASKEGWTVAVKLVRGAYIEHETRSLIHDTKEDTDRSYDDIVDSFISQKTPQTERSETHEFPPAALFLATHNRASAEKALEVHRTRILNKLPLTTLECGQIMGMADELSCALLESREECAADPTVSDDMIPRIFKFMAVGTVTECLGYLHRRAIENRGAVERTKHMVDALKEELRTRLIR